MSYKKHNIIHFLKTNKFIILLGFLLLLLIWIESGGTGDFDIFLLASRDLLTEGNIYKIGYIDGFHYYYDVLFALVIVPLQFIPPFWANFIWLLFNVFFTYRIWKIILFYLPVEELKNKQKQALAIVSFLMIFTFWHKNIHVSQMTIFILYLCLEGVSKIENKKFFLGSLFIGVGISIKILPIVLIPYLIYRGYFKAALYVVIATVVILLFPAFIIGYDYHVLLLQARWDLVNPLNSIHILDVSERSFHSLTSLLSILFVENAGNPFSLDLKRNIANVSLETLSLIINLTRLAFAASALFFINAWPFQKTENKLQLFYELSYILLLVPLIFPHQQHYAFFFVFPAVSYLVFYFIIKYFDEASKKISNLKKVSLIGMFVVIYFLFNSHFVLGEFRNIYDHFKTLTYGIIFLIPLLAIARPRKIDQIILDNKSN